MPELLFFPGYLGWIISTMRTKWVQEFTLFISKYDVGVSKKYNFSLKDTFSLRPLICVNTLFPDFLCEVQIT